MRRASAARIYSRPKRKSVLRAILTDSHFWLPLLVLLAGFALLLRLA